VKSKRSLADMLRNEWKVEETDHSSLSDVFDEEPPALTHFVQDKKFLNNLPLSAPQFDFVRHFEQVLYRETYILMVEEFGEAWLPVRFVNELSAQWGKGGGKDHVCQMSFARVSNILLCLKDPQAYFGMSHQTIFHMLNVAKSAEQAHGVFFKPLRTMLTSSSWFADKFESRPGPMAREIRFKHQIELISGHSEAESLEGKNLIAAIADEISAFPTGAEVMLSKTGRPPSKTADGILDMLRSSATSRFPFTYKLGQISYPRFKGDAIQQATAEAKLDVEQNGEESVYYFSGPIKTWDANPRYDSIDRVEVPGAGEPVPKVPAILKDYRLNPAFARAKYECDPDVAENRFFSNDTAIFDAFSDQRNVAPLTIEYYWGLEDHENWEKAETGMLKPKPGWQVRFHFSGDLAPYRGTLYALHGDMAISGDRAGVAMCHVQNWERRVWTKADGDITTESRPIVKVDFATCFEADAAAVNPEGKNVPREVQIRWYRKLIFELIRRGFAVGHVTFDRFASEDTIQILLSRGLEAERFSTDISNVGWETLRDTMYDGRLNGYWNELLVEEIRTLNLLPNGRVDHPPDGSKDIADALAGSVVGAVMLGGDESDEPERADTPLPDAYLMRPSGMGDLGIEGSMRLSPQDFGLSRSF
jgi:hypothetical protein